MNDFNTPASDSEPQGPVEPHEPLASAPVESDLPDPEPETQDDEDDTVEADTSDQGEPEAEEAPAEEESTEADEETPEAEEAPADVVDPVWDEEHGIQEPDGSESTLGDLRADEPVIELPESEVPAGPVEGEFDGAEDGNGQTD